MNDEPKNYIERKTVLFVWSLLIGLVAPLNAQNQKVTGGVGHTLAVQDGGAVWGWGLNTSGQLGDGTTLSRGTPSPVPGLIDVISVEAGPNYSIALKSDGSVWAWGDNTEGQLGDGTHINKSYPVQVIGLNSIVSISCGLVHSLALRSDGKVMAWGRNIAGQLGNGSYTTNNLIAVEVMGLSGVISIAAGGSHSLAATGDGAVWSWGSNAYYELGDGSNISQRSIAAVVPWVADASKVSAGYACSFVIRSDGSVVSFGDNLLGQLGLGYTSEMSLPEVISGLDDVASIDAGATHVIATRLDGMILGWGDNGLFQCGHESADFLFTPTPIVTPLPVVSVSAGTIHSVATDSSGRVLAWGSDIYEQLGNGDKIARSRPFQVVNQSGVDQLSAGRNHTLRLSDGKVFAHGSNAYGQLGDGSNADRISVVESTLPESIASIQSGIHHNFAIEKDSTVWSWGLNTSGQLGNGNTTTVVYPSKINALEDVVATAAGWYHSLAVKSNGELWAWGNNSFGQLGDNTHVMRRNPVRVSNLTGIKEAAAGMGHSLALKEDGTVWAWGQNYIGQLGDGTALNRLTPVRVQNLSGVTKVVTGGYGSLALKSDGTVAKWPAESGLTPGILPGLNAVVEMAVGGSHFVAMKDDGSVVTWGFNQNGQLGVGTTSFGQTPQLLPNVTLGSRGRVAASESVTYLIKEDGTLLTCGSEYNGMLENGISHRYNVPQEVLGFHRSASIPSVAIVSPSISSDVAQGQSVEISVSASDSIGAVAKVYFYSEGIYMGEDSDYPYIYNYVPKTWGDLSIHAVSQSTSGGFSKPSNAITIRTPYDSDSDGMPDWKEVRFFGSVAILPNDDYDNDGINNAEEMGAGLDPSNEDTDGDAIPDSEDQSPAIPLPPSLSLLELTYYHPKKVMISAASNRQKIYYTIDGSDPETSLSRFPVVNQKSIDVLESLTVRALAVSQFKVSGPSVAVVVEVSDLESSHNKNHRRPLYMLRPPK